MTHDCKVPSDAEPGTGTQYYTEATNRPREHVEMNPDLDIEDYGHRDLLGLRQFRCDGRTWECGREYFDLETREIYELVGVVRKSSWCSTEDAENGVLKFQFASERRGDIELSPHKPDESLTDRFVPRWRDNSGGPP